MRENNFLSGYKNLSNAKYIITDTFKITGRGLVLTGYISEGTIFIGDTIEFSALNKIRKRRIVGIEGMREAQSIKVNTGLIQCESDELRNWTPRNEVAIVVNK